MNKLTRTAYLTIHGHFYQPPRENPWTGKIELQPDAHPFHDWNDRILIQCYQPNAMARIVDNRGRVVEIVNNFRLLSFNIGPTLFEWLEQNAPVVYRRIIEGDRLSVQEHSGRGNAIAQVYNHMILPLANEEDQRTQIRWGIAEFKKRFSREPEGIWLPETAASECTLELLIEEGIRFTILSPEQADRVRPLRMEGAKGEAIAADALPWQDVSNGSIDPTRPYRFFHPEKPAGFIDLFFFDGPLSRDVSFCDLLFDSKKLLSRLLTAPLADRHHPEIVHLASDGETFGHHKAFGERVIAFLLHEEAERHGFRRTNYGEYLEKFPPQYEVKIKAGEGTSWSCAHGLGRWKEDCGCHTGGQVGWNQKWRTPLREAIRFLGDELRNLYQREAATLLPDPMAARDGYIDLILDRSLEARKKFFEKHSKRPLSDDEKIRAIKLLEMERFALLTETSCGWFFNDLSGIETVQILRYALRALELAAELGAAGLENRFLEILERARSNRPEFRDGLGVWEKRVKPSRMSPEMVVAHYAFRKLFELKTPEKDFYNYYFKEEEKEWESSGEMTLLMGTVALTGRTVPESRKFLYTISQRGLYQIQCFVKGLARADELQRINVMALSHLRKNEAFALVRHLRQLFASEPILLNHLLPEERDEILHVLARGMAEDYYRSAQRFYEENRPWAKLFHEAGRPLPAEFRGLIEWMLGERLLVAVKKIGAAVPIEEVIQNAKAILEEAASGGLTVRTQPTIEFLSEKLNTWIEKLFHGADPVLAGQIDKVLEMAKQLHIELHDRLAQELFFMFAQKTLREWIENYQGTRAEGPTLQAIQTLLRLGVQLGFNMERYENQLKVKNEELRVKGEK